MQTDLDALSAWLKFNKLKLIVNMTKFINMTKPRLAPHFFLIPYFYFQIFVCSRHFNKILTNQTIISLFHFLQSDPSFVPIRTADTTVSGTESDDSSVRSVRFNKLAEVREMSPHEAMEALMSRLSYSASLRISRTKSHHKTARTALMFCILVSLFLTIHLKHLLIYCFFFL
jgi:hypothetical protein